MSENVEDYTEVKMEVTVSTRRAEEDGVKTRRAEEDGTLAGGDSTKLEVLDETDCLFVEPVGGHRYSSRLREAFLDSIKCKVCGESFTAMADLTDHLRINAGRHGLMSDQEINLSPQRKPKATSKEGQFKCGVCEKTFPSTRKLLQHKVTHSSDAIICIVCSRTFQTLGDLQQHKKVHSKENVFDCDMCDEAFQIRSALFIHQSTMHTITPEDPVEINGNRKYACRYCGKAYKSLAHLREHERVHTNEKPFACVNCGKAFHRGSSLHHHMKVHSQNKTYPCVKCGTSFMSYFHLNRHKQFHKDRPFSCDICKKMYATKAKLSKHSSQHNKEALICDECNKKFKTKLELSRHKRIHKTAEKWHKCDVCNKSHKQASHLQKHKLSHRGTSKKPHVCRFCQKSYSRITQLNLHLQTHAKARSGKTLRKTSGQSDDTTQENKYNCGICSNTFETYYRMRKHKQMHKDRPYMCDSCEETFLVRAELRRHKQSECSDGYVCETCNKSFSTQHALQSHNIQHALERPYMCSVCHDSFKTTKQLKRHMQVHMEEKIHTCPVCDKEFAEKSNLKRHKQICSKSVSSSSLGKTHTNPAPDSSPSKSNRSKITGGDRLKCSSCKKIFKRVSDLKEHEQTHITQSHYLCDICGEAFEGKQLLHQHSEQHRNLPIKHSPRINKQLIAHEAGRANTEMAGVHTQLANRTSLIHVDSHRNLVPEFVRPSGVQVSGNCNLSIETHSIQQPSESCVQLLSLNSNAPVDALNANQQFPGLGTAVVHQPGAHVPSPDMMCPVCNKVFRNSLECELHIRSHYAIEPTISSICREALDALYSRENQRGLTGFVNHNNDALNNPQSSDNSKGVAVENSGSVSDSNGDYGMPDFSDEDDEPHVEMSCTEILNSLNSSGDPDSSKIDHMVVHQLLPRGKKCRLLLQKISLFTCDVCNKNFQSQELLDQHRTSHGNGREQPSRESSEQQAVSKDAESTSHSTTEVYKLTCEICSKQFPNNHRLQRHLLSHSKTKPHKCERCGKTYKHKCHMEEHQKDSCKGVDDGTTCTPASEQTSVDDSKQNKDQHRTSVGNDREQPSMGSSEQQAVSKDAESTSHRTTEVNKLTCEICSKQFPNNHRLQRHLLSHSKTKPHKCERCGKTYKQICHMKEHQRDSCKFREDFGKISKLFRCDICTKPFMSSLDLKAHQRIHSDEILHECDRCGKVYKHRHHMKAHQRDSCKGVKDGITCTPASEQTSVDDSKQDKDQHRKEHQRDSCKFKEDCGKISKLFRCNICTKPFVSSLDLKAHQRVHSDEICGEDFSNQLNLQSHLKTHSDTHPFKCDPCGRVYRYEQDLKMHQKLCVHLRCASAHSQQGDKTCTLLLGSKITRCCYCLKWLHSLDNLLKHENFHCAKRKRKCECGQVFAEEAELLRHRASHNDSLRNAKVNAVAEVDNHNDSSAANGNHQSTQDSPCLADGILPQLEPEVRAPPNESLVMSNDRRASEQSRQTKIVENVDCGSQNETPQSPLSGHLSKDDSCKGLNVHQGDKEKDLSKTFHPSISVTQGDRMVQDIVYTPQNDTRTNSSSTDELQQTTQPEDDCCEHSSEKTNGCEAVDGETFKECLDSEGSNTDCSTAADCAPVTVNNTSDCAESDKQPLQTCSQEHQTIEESTPTATTCEAAADCQICTDGFTTIESLYQHLGCYSAQDLLKCEKCGRVFKCKRQRQRHQAGPCRKLPPRNTKGFRYPYQFERHENTHSNLRRYECDCGKAFKQKYDLVSHRQMHHGDKTVESDSKDANESFLNEASEDSEQSDEETSDASKQMSTKLQKHSTNTNGTLSQRRPLGRKASTNGRMNSEVHKCEVCSKEFAKRRLLVKHAKSHADDRPYVCKACGKSYQHSHLLRHHQTYACRKIKDAEKKPLADEVNLRFKCPCCCKSFQYAYQLERHENTHYPDKKYTCGCGKAFKQRYELTRHRNKHDCIGNTTKMINIKLVKCEVCFKNIFKLQFYEHMKCHSEEYQFKCDGCGKRYKHKDHMKYHKATNCMGVPIVTVCTDKRPHKCDRCKADFPKQSMLMKHQFKVHNVATPGTKYQLKCQVCPRTFSFEFQLERHKQVHYNEREHKCVCGLTFKRQLMLWKHLSEDHVTPRLHSCNICVQMFSSGKFLRCHVGKQHDTRSFKCHKCSNTFLKSKHLKDHRQRVHKSRRRFRCGSCRRDFVKRSKLVSHELSHKVHTETASCELCGKRFKGKQSLSRHKLMYHPGDYLCKDQVNLQSKPNVKCDLCGKTFLEQSSLARHSNVTHHKLIPYICVPCNKTFLTFFEMKTHEVKHKENFTCKICNAGLENLHRLRNHCLAHTRNWNFICEICGKSSTNLKGLKQHQLIHLGKSLFVCEICNGGFKSKADLDAHVNTHNLDNVCVCDVCGTLSSSRIALMKHMKSHSDNKHLECKTCGKGFHSKQYLLAHLKIHNKGAEEHCCTVCGKSFTRKCFLTMHSRSHQDKQRSCKICKKVFNRTSSLTLHMRHHNNIQPYSCKFCNKTFFNRRVRDNHHNIHTKEKPHKCKVCGDCFASSATLFRHKKVHEKKNSKWERDRLVKEKPNMRKRERSVKEEPKKRRRKAKR